MARCSEAIASNSDRGPPTLHGRRVRFDHVITREDKDILESTDPNALVDTRRRGVEFSMDSDKPGMLIRKHLMELLAAHGEVEVFG